MGTLVVAGIFSGKPSRMSVLCGRGRKPEGMLLQSSLHDGSDDDLWLLAC